MAVGTPALVGGQHVVIRPEMSPHASAVLFVSARKLSFIHSFKQCSRLPQKTRRKVEQLPHKGLFGDHALLHLANAAVRIYP
jgi:hypothetical protein